ncbi:S-methyl-5-thioribose-1-phosphate isomerase, partial [Myxococcota bacterium]|nr:S-methyl-5-thioribose-1-phosphate isomerase [Myxococcota bacterium]
MDTITPLKYENNALNLLDQRELPLVEKWISCTALEDVATAIETMVVRGAPAIGCAAAYGYWLGVAALEPWPGNAADYQAAVAPVSSRLGATRPTAVNLFWAIEAMEGVAYEHDRRAMLSALLERAHTITRDDLSACRAMGDFGASRLPSGRISVLTHCNAGALATAGYGTALGVIRSLHGQGRLEMAYADDTRPRQQGARLTVWELHHDGIPVTLVPDTAAGHLLKSGKVQAVVVGADRIAANGDAANKIGTYMVALAAKAHGVPFFVAAPL